MRTWKIWFLDSSKQIFGQLTQHMLNLLIAYRIGRSKGLECEWYMNNLITDATIGVLINYIYLKCFERLLMNTRFEFNSGDYGKDKIMYGSYFYQLFIWIIIIMIV